jgi:superfamily II DNA or RNA helicase
MPEKASPLPSLASVATLGRADSSRIKKFPSRHFGVIVVDEAQHCTADSYLRILRYFGAGEPNGPVLQDRGHAAEGLTTWTSRQDRWQALRRFRDGQTRIMVNCGVLTEGYDTPAIDCLVMGRPTKSPLLYRQMLGRATRQSPDTGKKDALIIDIVDVCGRHRIQTAAERTIQNLSY